MNKTFFDTADKIWEKDPLKNFYNLNGLTDIILTCDVDWAPDFAIDYIIDTIYKYGLKISVFATHDSNVLKTNEGFIDVGLHPDFTRYKSSLNFEEKLFALKEIYPDAMGMRSHRNFFGQNIGDIAKKCGLIYDASAFLWNEPFCQAYLDYNGLVRFSYMWEDGIHLDMENELSWNNIKLNTPGLKIINVHPILIYLNSSSEKHRRSVTSKYSDLTKATKAEIDNEVNHKYGINTLWIELLDEIKSRKIKTHLLKDLAVITKNL